VTLKTGVMMLKMQKKKKKSYFTILVLLYFRSDKSILGEHK